MRKRTCTTGGFAFLTRQSVDFVGREGIKKAILLIPFHRRYRRNPARDSNCRPNACHAAPTGSHSKCGSGMPRLTNRGIFWIALFMPSHRTGSGNGSRDHPKPNHGAPANDDALEYEATRSNAIFITSEEPARTSPPQRR